jgi:threonine dehydrogenase-like Zn-dependent dehydrogenase
MRGVVFPGDRNVSYVDVPDPSPGPLGVIVEMKASGMCGTDLQNYRRPGRALTIFRQTDRPTSLMGP